jgi:CRP-like cAMP-binding protein
LFPLVGFKASLRSEVRSLVPPNELTKYDIFLEFDPSELAELAMIAEVVEAAEGQEIIQEGMPPSIFYVMEQGNIMVAFSDGRALTLHGAGEIIGWSALIYPIRYTASVVCLTDSVFIAFPGRELLGLVQHNQALGAKLRQRILQRVVNRMHFIADTVKQNLNGER